MTKATLTKRLEFCASHRYHNPDWDETKNREVFGPCNNVNSHGHNYLLEATFEGTIDPVTGMIINLYDLKIILNQILEQFDHKNLNLDTPFFSDTVPTTENLALTLWEILHKHPDLPRLESLRLYEDENLYAEAFPEKPDHPQPHDAGVAVLIARRYRFSAVHHESTGQERGHNYEMWVCLKGPVDRETGQVINLSTLDDLVNERVLTRWNRKNLNRDPVGFNGPVTDSSLAAAAWAMLAPAIKGPALVRVSVSQGEDTSASALC